MAGDEPAERRHSLAKSEPFITINHGQQVGVVEVNTTSASPIQTAGETVEGDFHMTNSINIGLDHGFHLVKTKNFIFENGVNKTDTPPTLTTGTLFYDGCYYKIGEDRMKVKDSKTMDQDYFILTLAGMAKEIHYRGLNPKVNVILAVGIPFTRFGEEKSAFVNYLKREKEICYSYEGKNYEVTIDGVKCFPQCYAAVADRLSSMNGDYVICDIGSWTTDIMFVRNGVPLESKCQTFTNSIISTMQSISKQKIGISGSNIPESVIMDYIAGKNVYLGLEHKKLIDNTLIAFAKNIEGILKENGHNLEFCNVIYVGGGAEIMKKYGTHGMNISYLEDVRANAKGYEFLARNV